MGAVLTWIRSNPITVGAVVVALCSVALLFVVQSQGNEFVTKMGERDRVIRQIKLFTQSPVRTPSADPNEPEQHSSIAINQAAIDTLTQAFDRMDGEYREIFELAVGVNSHNHEPMVQGLFPIPQSDYKPFDAKDKYRRAFKQMLRAPRLSEGNAARLNAGTPAAVETLQVVVESATAEFMDTFFPPKTIGLLTPEEADELKNIQSRKAIEALQQHASEINIYVKTADINNAGFPFEVDTWSVGDRRPDMAEVWEGQVGLWIQQDIVEAIARANRVGDPQSNVINAPVKQLIKIHLDQKARYVGAERLREIAAGPGTERVRVAGRYRTKVREPGPMTKAEAAASNERLPYDFSVSPTGRTSNELYDVWHVGVQLIVDWQKLPELFRHIQQVNFMTVLDVNVKGVDEYAALEKGMIFGSGDAVEVDILLESIWLREWTKELMPPKVRERLGIKH